jgi:predicted nucleotide-binding protein (sugar kinase/HSP70/actin superfamily)
MHKYEKDIKSVLCKSGLVMTEPVNIRTVVDNATPYMSHNLTGEAILTIGSTLTDIASHVCGVIAIGPFGCMPNRIAEAILAKTVNRKCKLATAPKDRQLKEILKDFEDLPFFAIETDGSTFPHLVQAKLETFCLRASRLHESMLSSYNGKREKKVKIAGK